ncbi:MAG: Ig-like domain-containing protein [Limisphaerales bacterium]
MFDSLNHLILGVMDLVVGWLLVLPRDASILLVAVSTALLLAWVRKFTTNQDLLRRCAADRKRLRELRRTARRARDQVALARLRLTQNRVAIRAFSQEWKPMLASLAPIALLATWCWQRLEYLPPKPGEPVTFTASFPISAAGRLAHLVPADGLQAPQGWIQAITADTNTATAHATWTLTGTRGRHSVTLRYHGRTFQHPLLLGEREYQVPLLAHDSPGIRTAFELQPARLFGLVPGLPGLGLAPWLVAYLLVAMVAYPGAKRLLRVC